MAASVLGFLTCALMLMIVIAHGDCADIVRESALKLTLEVSGDPVFTASVFRLPLRSDTLPTELVIPCVIP